MIFQASKELGDINYSCTDPDIGQNLTLSITSGTHMTYFSLSSQSDSLSIISYALDWDLENETLPTNTTLTLTCDDGNGLFDSATIDLFMEAVNEFPPDLDTSSAELEINASTSVIDILLTVAATDLDYGDDGIFFFNVLGVGEGSKYFVMTTNGELKLKDYIEWNYNYTFSFTIEVTDEEKSGDYLTSYVDIIVHYVAAPPEDPEIITYCLTCTTEGIVIVAVLGLEACFLIGMIVHITVRCRAWELCTGRSRAIYDTE